MAKTVGDLETDVAGFSDASPVGFRGEDGRWQALKSSTEITADDGSTVCLLEFEFTHKPYYGSYYSK